MESLTLNTEKENKTTNNPIHAHQQNWHYEVFRSHKDTAGVRILCPRQLWDPQHHSTGGLHAAQAPRHGGSRRVPSCGQVVGFCWVSSKRSQFLHLVAQSLGWHESSQYYRLEISQPCWLCRSHIRHFFCSHAFAAI